jgi:hypothetical protein
MVISPSVSPIPEPPNKSHYTPAKIALLVVLVRLGVILCGGTALLIGGLVWFGHTCDAVAKKVRAEDAVAQAVVAQIRPSGIGPSVVSLSNTDCVDGGNATVHATYGSLSGDVDTVHAAVLAALPKRATMSSALHPVTDDFVTGRTIRAVEDIIIIDGRKYIAHYELATPFECPVTTETEKCDYLHAYQLYHLGQQPVGSVMVQFNETQLH